MKKATTRINKLRRRQVKDIFKEILKGIGYLIVGILYILKETYTGFEKAFLTVWKKFPKWVVRIIVWTMIFNIVILNDKAPEIIEKIRTEVKIKEVYAIKEVLVQPEECSYGLYECAVYNEAIKQGLNEEQAKISIAISQWETGHYKSELFWNNNNIGGLYNSYAKKFYTYNTIEEGIEAYIKNLKNGYFEKGLNTIEEIQKKYCPVGAENDPTGLNNYWLDGVTNLYNEL